MDLLILHTRVDSHGRHAPLVEAIDLILHECYERCDHERQPVV